jgi:hypothetical protein
MVSSKKDGSDFSLMRIISTHNASWNLETDDVQADPVTFRGRLTSMGEMSEEYAHLLHRGSSGSMYTKKARATWETPMRDQG